MISRVETRGDTQAPLGTFPRYFLTGTAELSSGIEVRAEVNSNEFQLEEQIRFRKSKEANV